MGDYRNRLGLKLSVCACVYGKLCWWQWWGRMIAFWKKRDGEERRGEGMETQSASALSLVPALSLGLNTTLALLYTEVTDERLHVAALAASQFSTL